MKKLLIIEDNELMKTFLANYFGSEYIVEHVSTPSEAITKLNTGNPQSYDAVISDFKDASNLEYNRLKEVTDHVNESNVPMIILTDEDKSEQRLQSLSLGARDTLSKPFNPKELDMRVTSLIGQATFSQSILRKAA